MPKKIFFFGIAAKHALEKDARNIAMRPLKELDFLGKREIFANLGKIDNSQVRDVIRIISSIPKNERSEGIVIIRTVEK